ncbi:MAG: hypothetical protein AAF982_05690 [Pseudomonadota bacterium]
MTPVAIASIPVGLVSGAALTAVRIDGRAAMMYARLTTFDPTGMKFA